LDEAAKILVAGVNNSFLIFEAYSKVLKWVKMDKMREKTGIKLSRKASKI